MADFETTVYKNQTYTEVWAAAAVELFTENVIVWNDISGLWEYLTSLKENIVCYFHNLKFDGEFLLHHLLQTLKFKPALFQDDNDDYHFAKAKDMENGELTYSISEMGQWYSVKVKVAGKLIEFRDSMKLLPFSLERISNSFKTKHKKLKIEYEGERHAFGVIKPDEEGYIKNDVLVGKEALEIMYQEGHNKLTIGSCCWKEWKKTYEKEDFENFFPNLAEVKCPDYCGDTDADSYVRHGYKGAWCYVAPDKAGKQLGAGSTFDVNSLYPSQMHSSSGNYYPVGKPHFWQGNYLPERLIRNKKLYYFVRVKTRFYLKPGKLPFIQIKNTFRYLGNKCLETSDIEDENGNYHSHYRNLEGKMEPTTVTMTWTKTDFELIKEHYDLVDFEILDGCWFFTEIGLFDTYINKYAKIKAESTGAIREQAKLFLNNLYGKLATNQDSSFKIAVIKEDGSMGFIVQHEREKQPGYIAGGAAITSYARAFTIRAAQKNYHPGKPGFCYADTDSIHCDLPAEQVKGIRIHETDFNAWKNESNWDTAHFVRQKTYMEHVVGENNKEVEPYWVVKCAGMPKVCKDLFIRSMSGIKPAKREREKLGKEKVSFLRKGRTMMDFTYGLTIPGKLMPVHYPGGIVLEETYFSMR